MSSQLAPHDAPAAARVFDLLVQHAQGNLCVFHQLCARLRYSLACCDRARPTMSAIVHAARLITPASLPAFVGLLGRAAGCASWEAAMELVSSTRAPPIDLLSASLPAPELLARAADLSFCGLDLVDTAISPLKKRPLDDHDHVRHRQVRAALERQSQASVAIAQVAALLA